jgi:putative ABC transport system permease protein
VRAFAIAIADQGAPYWLQFEFDWRVFAFVATASLSAAVLFGLAPAVHTARVNVSGMLGDASRGVAGQLRVLRFSGVMVAAQLALAILLVTGSGLMLRTFMAQYALQTGIDTSDLLRARLDLSGPRYRERAARAAFYRQLDERLATAPGLTAATVASEAPRGGGYDRQIVVDDDTSHVRRVLAVSAGADYFSTLGATFLRGAPFTAADRTLGASRAIINERLAHLRFGNSDPLGQPLQLTSTTGAGIDRVTIAGVIRDIRQLGGPDPALATGTAIEPVIYFPIEAEPTIGATVIVRASSVGRAAALIRDQVRALDPDLPIYDMRTIDDALASRMGTNRLFASMFVAFAVMALALATVGLYAVMAFGVAQRAREIGVRMALGARRHDVLWIVSRRAATQLGAGAVIGIAATTAVSRLLPQELVQVQTSDVQVIVGLATVLLVVGVLAAWAPARQALEIDPASALRAQ